MKIDKDFQALIFALSLDEYLQLEKNIIKDGCRDSLVVWKEEDILIDGHNRYKICSENKIEYKTKLLSFKDRQEVEDWIDTNQLGRRNLSPDMMRLLRGRLYNRTKKDEHDGGKGEKRSGDQNEPHLKTADRIAKSSGVSPATVKRDAKFAKEIEAKPELMQAIKERIPIKKIEKEIRTLEIKKERDKIAEKSKQLTPNEKWLVEQGDICTYKTEKQFDYIITDPPYPKEYLPLYEVLANRACDLLVPNGLIIVMCGQSYLDQIYEMMSRHLEYYWTASYLTLGQPTPLRDRQVNSTWKPILMFTRKGDKYKGKIFGDVFNSDGNDKSMHKWGQSESGMLSIISSICLPGQSVFDPFCGAGTTGISAYKFGCTFHGVDIEKENVDICNGRFVEVEK